MSEQTAPTFEALGLSPRVLETLTSLGYEAPTPVQSRAIPLLLEGRDLIGSAATGTGKTAAFALPILERLDPSVRGVQALVLTPTRELAVQVAEALHTYSKGQQVRVLPVYGGQPIFHQLKALKRGVQVVVGTPGRLLDHLQRGSLRLDEVQLVVLDEADEMLDMGFVDDIEAVLEAAPDEHQTALFSATFPPKVERLGRRYLTDPARVEIEATHLDTPLVRQQAYLVPRSHKVEALGRILDHEAPTASIVFCRTRMEVDTLSSALGVRGFRPAALHGGLSQQQRDRIMGQFKEGAIDILVATDVAARGLHVDHLSHVFNYNIPESPETYVHRIGRTGRAGKEGTAITLVEPREHRFIKSIERLTGQKVEQARIPTVADLRARRVELQRAALRELLLAGDFEGYRGAIASLAEHFDLMDIAAAALRLAADAAHGDDLEEAEEIPQVEVRGPKGKRFEGSRAARPPYERGPRRGDRDERGDRGAPPRRSAPGGPMVRLYVSVGRRKGVRPGDLVGAIASEADIPGKAIGAIEITERFSLVEVSESYSQQVLARSGRFALKGAKVQIRPAREE